MLWVILFSWLVWRSDIVFAVNSEGAIADPLLASGLSLIVGGLALSIGIEPSLAYALNRMQKDQVVKLNDATLKAARVALWGTLRTKYVLVGAGVTVSTVLTGFLIANVGPAYWLDLDQYVYSCPFDATKRPMTEGHFPRIGYMVCPRHKELLLAAILLAACVGGRLGVLHANAYAFRAIIRPSAEIMLVPGHPDTAGGTGSLGNFMLYSALILLITAASTIVLIFCVLILWRDQTDEMWLFCLAGTSVIAWTYLFLGFYRPFSLIATTIQKQKHELEERHLPEIDVELAALRERAKDARPIDAKNIYKEIADLIEYRREVTSLPSWPIGSIGKRMLSIGSLAPFLPFLLNLAAPQLKVFADGILLLIKSAGAG